jgi:hypothetical protein
MFCYCFESSLLATFLFYRKSFAQVLFSHGIAGWDGLLLVLQSFLLYNSDLAKFAPLKKSIAHDEKRLDPIVCLCYYICFCTT